MAVLLGLIRPILVMVIYIDRPTPIVGGSCYYNIRVTMLELLAFTQFYLSPNIGLFLFVHFKVPTQSLTHYPTYSF
jgi:hypothetical protein